MNEVPLLYITHFFEGVSGTCQALLQIHMTLVLQVQHCFPIDILESHRSVALSNVCTM